MNTRWQLHRLGLLTSAFLLGTFACRVETIELHGVAVGGSTGDLGGTELTAAGNVNEIPADPVSPPAPETLLPPELAAPDMPDIGYYEPLPDAGVDLSPLPPAEGCRNVDFLFVVDNSLSMTAEQNNLVESFPGFMEVVKTTLDAQDYHIMAVDTDDRGISLGDVFGGVFASPSSCNGVFGAGRQQGSRGQDCGIAGAASYMTQAQSDLESTFECAALVGTFGDVLEQPMTALLSAVGAPLNAPGGCNAGFLRDDAILVVTFITDEDDTRSPGNPATWRQQLVDAKGGDEEAVVVLGLLGDADLESGLEDACLPPDAEPAPRLQQFVQSLPHGSLGSVCAEDYSPFLARAVSVIDEACQTFTPPLR